MYIQCAELQVIFYAYRYNFVYYFIYYKKLTKADNYFELVVRCIPCTYGLHLIG